MNARILYFARLKDLCGAAEAQEAVLPGDCVGALKARLLAAALDEDGLRSVRCAVNGELVGDLHPVADGDEVAFLPPVSGG
jgi:molybdopterin converting factor subunit 1